MKRKLSIIGKRTSMILLGAALMCLLSSCDANDKSGNYESVIEEIEIVELNEVNNGEQHSGTENETERDTVYAGNEHEQVSADAGNEQGQVSADISNEQPNDSSVEGDEQLPLSAEDNYKAVLLNNGDFISTDMQNKKINLTNIKEMVTDDESITVTATKFAVMDLDNDGQNEIILWIQINGISDYGFEILRYQEGAVYGYTLQYREFMDLKTDGTFIFSGGAADLGIGKLSFSGNGYVIDRLYYSESQYNSNNELEVRYIANGTLYSEEEFNNDMSHQGEKSNVKWYDLTLGNVESAF
ncbi:MAG: hypothetical protein NC313_09270 [Butyrivibrio sp.]|nr:hypothetical protein [Butyrivibrio sp.]